MTYFRSLKLLFKGFTSKCLKVIALAAVMLLFSAAFAQADMSITVSMSSDTYDPGETVTISGAVGDVSGIPVPGAMVSIQVNDPIDQPIHINMVYSASDGSYTDSFVLRNDSLTGDYRVFVVASKLGLGNCSAQISFSVPRPVVNQTSDFAISVAPSARTIKPGESAQFNLSLISVGGFAFSVSLTLLGVPPSFEISFNPQVVAPNGSSTLTVHAQPTSKNGSYVLTIVASGGGKSHSTNVTLIVQGSGCLIATATYGSELASQVQFLRGFREKQVMPTLAGRQFLYGFNIFYYSFSPKVARWIESSDGLRFLCKIALYPLILILKFAAKLNDLLGFSREIGVIISGFVASVLIGTIYCSPIALALRRILKMSKTHLRTRFDKPMLVVLLSSIVAMSVGEVLPFYVTMTVATAVFVIATISLSVVMFIRFFDSHVKNLSRL